MPEGCVALFLALYTLSAALYPGGTREDPSYRGFSLAQSYTCDLFDEKGYSGLSNPGRPFALVAMAVLAVGLVALFWHVPHVAPEAKRRRTVVRTAGLTSCLFAPFVATRFHDLVIDGAGLLAFVAFAASMSLVGRRGNGLLVGLAGSACAAAVVTLAIWHSRVGVHYLPGIQKVFLGLFVLWILAMSREVRAKALAPRDT